MTLYIHPRDLHREHDEVVDKVFRSILCSRLPITSFICEYVLPRWAWRLVGVKLKMIGIPPRYEVWGLGLKVATFEVQQENTTTA